jgi:hypothetical protein
VRLERQFGPALEYYGVRLPIRELDERFGISGGTLEIIDTVFLFAMKGALRLHDRPRRQCRMNEVPDFSAEEFSAVAVAADVLGSRLPLSPKFGSEVAN